MDWALRDIILSDSHRRKDLGKSNKRKKTATNAK